ncbi:MAG TPA: thioesterase family protein [Saprospiraceae bacterium]|nr:thioesterase family protein [Saprospiraceae bacterium]
MFTHEMEVRVRYGETDKMGYVYYGNYMQYYEIGRVEALRHLGIRYADMEDVHGVFMPVVSLQVRYLRPAYYDNLVRIETSIPELPASKVKFDTRIFNEKNELINSAQVILCFVDTKTFVRMDAPAVITEKLIPYFENT